MRSPRLAAFLLAFLFFHSVRGAVVINEVFTAGSDRLLRWDANGTPRVGTGPAWQEPAFVDTGWQTGPGPFGYGTFTTTPTATFGTDVATRMQYLTPSLYVRKSFTVAADDATLTDAVQLTISYNDGFICYLNGVEVARRLGGPAKQFHYHDQPAYSANLSVTTNPATYATETISLGLAQALLTPGTNVLAIQGLNATYTSSNFLLKADLQIAGATVTPLVANNDPWRYFPGVVEPAGGLYDPALLFSGKLKVPWGAADFDDSDWIYGAGPMRVGTAGAGTVLTGVVGQTPSVYARTSFTVTAAQAADTLPLKLLVDYDDSFVAYINGVEVARANVGDVNKFTPSSAVATTTRNNGSQTTFTIDTPANLLTAGTNELAIQVHNVTISDTDLYLKADLKTNGGTTLVLNTQTWHYLVGTSEPVAEVDLDDEESPDGPDSVSKWIELYNNGTAAVALGGWTLTDSTNNKTKWKFPTVSIPAGGYLLVLCDGLDITNNPGGYLHTNFKLSDAGEFLGLYDANAAAVDRILPAIPPLDPFHSYGRDANGNLAFFDLPTPGTANTGTTETGFAATPTFGLASGFYTGTQSVTLSTTTLGATIRYTLDGSEPTATTGTAYLNAISVPASGAIRARAFATGLIPSSVASGTYLIGEAAARKTIPAICIVADLNRTLYRPYGVMAIDNDLTANFTAGPWATTNSDPLQYNNPSLHGKFIERPSGLELFYPAGTAPTGYLGFKKDTGLRLSGSPYTRPRYVLTAQNSATPNAGTWGTSATTKCSFNFYFRDELGGDTLDLPIFPQSTITSYHDLRFRAGHNDTNPFVQDETVRRLYLDMGQVGSAGVLTTFYVNGVYKGYYNLCQHLKEDFFQKSYHTDNSFDVRQVADVSAGDGIAFQEMITFARVNSQATLANYQGMQTRLDMVNFCDYLLVNSYCETQDWPHNNFVCSRERSATGLHRFHVWDAEGSFGSFSGSIRSNSFRAGSYSALNLASPISTTTTDTSLTNGIKILYTALQNSPEFRLLFADRIQKHLVNSNGALSDANILARFGALKTQITPFLTPTDRVTPWVNGVGADRTHYTLASGSTGSVTNQPSRKTIMLSGYTDDQVTYPTPVTFVGQYQGEGLWPTTVAPVFSQLGGSVAAGYQLTISNPNGAGTIYYTTNGYDPRAAGGAVAGAAYVSPVTISQTTLVRARVLNTTGEWSPLMEATFTLSAIPTVLITELMYHPPDLGTIGGDEYQFIEIKNTGATALAINGWQLTDGVSFTFPSGATLAPGGFAVVVKNATQFAIKYPSVTVAGVFSESLSHSGELVSLKDVSGATVTSVTYGTTSPWPALPDGFGNSLVPVNPNSNASPSTATNWRTSAALGGSPGADDPAPTIPAILVNEILTNSVSPQKDAVELYNPTAQTVDISYWYLSDNNSTKTKFQIPAGTLIAAGGYRVFTEDDFNAAIPVGTNVSFGFDSAGEEVRLNSGDSTGALTGYSHGFKFNAASPGVSFGRYVTSDGAEYFPPQKSQSLGAANSGPLPSPVVITEMMPIPSAGNDEFIELRNVSNGSVPLYDTASPSSGGWRVDGFGYTFASGVTLSPGQIVLVVPLTPAAWRTKYGTPANITIYGPCTGALKDGGEPITLQKPGTPYLNGTTTVVPNIDVDLVNYLPGTPWPALSAGVALERVNPFAYGSEPTNWRAGTTNGSPGAPPRVTFASWQSVYFTTAQLADPAISGTNADPDGDGLTNQMEWAMGLDPLSPSKAGMSFGLAMDGAAGPYLTMQFRRSLGISAGTQFFLDTTSTPGTWTLGGGTLVGTPANNGDGTETVIMRDTVIATPGTSPQRFIRLRVVGN